MVRIRLPPAGSLVRTWFCRRLPYPAPYVIMGQLAAV
jgi:hypothetical protein